MRRELVDFLKTRFKFSQRRACRLVGIGVSVYRYKPDTSRDDEVIEGLQGVVSRYPAYGFGKLFKVLRREGRSWNHKRVHRIYCLLNLNKRRRGKKRLPSRSPVQVALPLTTNGCWSMDFMSDSLFCGHRFRTFNVVDDFSRDSYVERFNRTFRDEVLNMYVFRSLSEVHEITQNWISEYNEERPHDSLGDLTPYEFMATSKPPENSNFLCA